ncbi:hypothetical protein GCM10010349_78280 [Streptomyces flavofungini]|nr:hypothetical protein GCM10010349_78280 [Streptomyces flavofungini]
MVEGHVRAGCPAVTLAAAQITLLKAAREHRLRSVLAFSHRIADSESFTTQFHRLLPLLPHETIPTGEGHCTHIDGTHTHIQCTDTLASLSNQSPDRWHGP